MKKLLNLLMILIVGVSTFLNIPSVNAASDHLYVDYSDGFTFAEEWNGRWISTPQNLIRRASDNSLVYCIQAHVVLADGDSWVMFVREAVEAMYMQYSAMDIKSMEYKFNRLIINI